MSWAYPDVICAYDPNESSNLKAPLTPLPTAFSFASLTDSTVRAVENLSPQPVLPAFTEPGRQVCTSFEDWYYRIHVIPAALSLGNIAGDLQREALIWNAYLSPVELQSVSITEDQGLSFAGGPAAPYVAGPLEEVRYTVAVSGGGSSTIDAEARWVIDGVEYVVPITGVRSLLFGFRPDWKLARLQETYEWRNTLTSSYSGLEQVMSVRAEPRRYLEYAFRLHQRETRLLDSSLFGWAGRVYGLPWWTERTPLEQTAYSGASVVFVNTADRSFVAGGNAVLYKSAVEYDILDILEVLPDRLVLRNTVTRDWPYASHVYPVLSAVPGDEISTSRAVPSHVDGAVRFTVMPSDAVINLPIEPAPATYREHELYTGETNWRRPLGISVTARRKDVDGVTGPLSVRRKSDFPQIVRGFSWLARSRADIRSLLALLARRQGRRYPMWVPSGVDDFRLLEDIVGGQNSVLVERSENGRLIGTNEARRDVVFLLRSGAPIARRVLSIQDEGDASRITFTEAFEQPVPRYEVKRLSYLGLYRLGADAITLSWVTRTVAEVDVNLVLKKDRP